MYIVIALAQYIGQHGETNPSTAQSAITTSSFRFNVAKTRVIKKKRKKQV